MPSNEKKTFLLDCLANCPQCEKSKIPLKNGISAYVAKARQLCAECLLVRTADDAHKSFAKFETCARQKSFSVCAAIMKQEITLAVQSGMVIHDCFKARYQFFLQKVAAADACRVYWLHEVTYSFEDTSLAIKDDWKNVLEAMTTPSQPLVQAWCWQAEEHEKEHIPTPEELIEEAWKNHIPTPDELMEEAWTEAEALEVSRNAENKASIHFLCDMPIPQQQELVWDEDIGMFVDPSELL